MNAHTKVEAEGLSSALVAALAEIGGATKDKVNAAFKSKYADLGSVIDAIKPILASHGLAFTQSNEPSEGGVVVETFLWHGSQPGPHSLGKLFVPANKNDAQAYGSALTYCRRYGLMTAFGVPAEDDDGNAAARSVSPRADPALTGTIEDWQIAQLQTCASGGVIDASRFCAFFGIKAFPELPAARWGEANAMVEAKANAKAGAK